ncbi:MAG TPA: cyclopropane-fatty-acyl-phospholipid synthase family protein [Streptosporangiaceae bacterium]|jgi:cyclopropane-fatty-acyl-phospholipid synthase
MRHAVQTEATTTTWPAAPVPAAAAPALAEPVPARTSQTRPDQTRAASAAQAAQAQPVTAWPARSELDLVDPARWPDVAAVPSDRARTAIARAVFAHAAGRLPIQVRLPGGKRIGAGGPGTPEMVLHRPADFFARIGAGSLIGFGESYMAGDWDCADLTGLITVFADQVSTLVPPPLQRLRRLAVRRAPAAVDGSEAGARRNIPHHYDLSNELFALFLDETMTYSAALFETSPTAPASPGKPGLAAPGPVAARPGDADSVLAAAQRRKIDRLLDLARVGPDSRVLEIGTGWGELAIRAAARGATVRTITLAEQQQSLAVRRVNEAGLAGRVSVELRDYRQVEGRYDAIVSAEMVEAVGERYWPAYVTALDRLLAPGGRIALQAITMPHDRLLATRDTFTWILKYIFPGGLIPSVTAIEENLARHTSLRVTQRFDFGPHYAQTLRIWRERFCARRDDVLGLGFDEVFCRMWLLYLCYSEAGFGSSYLDVCHLLLERDR